MSETGVPGFAGAAQAAAGLTQWQRVAYTFTAPSKTFDDIRRGNRSWWLPLIVLALASYMLFGAVVQKVGIRQAVENQITINPSAQEQMAKATPEQREKGLQFWTVFTEVLFIAGPALQMLYGVVFAAVLMGTINFGFGGRAKFGDLFAVVYYAWLPQVVKVLLGTAVIYAGMAPESFNIKNFAPTNLGVFFDPVETNKALYTLATWVDAITIWRLVLLGMGIAIVAGTKRSSGYIAVFGWWVLCLLVAVGFAAVTG
jgi:hypothetical protein